MADVHIDSLIIENFGPFYLEHKFHFQGLDGKGAVLIGGKNGAGKTHLLRALYLAAVGEGGRGDLRTLESDSDATKFKLENSLNRRAAREGNDTSRLAITISQRTEDGAGGKKITLVREIRHRTNSAPVFTSYAMKDDGNRIETEQMIQRLRDTFLPRHLARFFFFDAERGQSINLTEKDIVEGINRVLGLWSFSALEDDLRTISQKHRSTTSEPEMHLADVQADIQKAESHIRVKEAEQVGVDEELADVEADLVEVEDELKTIGAVDPEDLLKAQERRDEIAKARGQLEKTLEEAWEIALPVGVLGSFRSRLADDLIREERKRDWDSARSSVEPKIPQVKADVFDRAPEDFALDDARLSFYAERLERALLRLFHPPPEGMADTIFLTDRSDQSAQIRSRLMSSPARVRDLAAQSEELDKLDAEARELEQKMRNLQQNRTALERGQELREKRGQLLARIESLKRQLDEIATLLATETERLQELKREETNLTATVNKVKESRSLAALASRYRDAVGEIQRRAAIQLRETMSDYVGELWIQIADRKHEFTALEFDQAWNCWLLRGDGKRLAWDEINASAGQRQVRLLAFTEALRRLARLTPPLVVDTPLGRLDKEVRDAVLDQVYLAGHQSIVLSTNEEIDPEGPRFARIRSRLARVYTLHAYGDPASPDYQVRVTGDYFGHSL